MTNNSQPQVRLFERLAKDTVVYGGADLVTKILAFFVFPIIAANLSLKAFGALELILTVTAIGGLILNCGLNNAAARFYWDKGTNSQIRPAIITSGFLSQMFFGLLTFILGLAVLPLILPLTIDAGWPLSWISLVAALVAMVFSQWSQYAVEVTRLHFAPWRFFFLALTSRVFSTFLGLGAVVLLHWGVDGFLSAQALGLILVLPIALWVIRRDFKPARWDWHWAKKMIQYGYPFIYSGLAYWLFGYMDRWMLASMSSVEEVGVYSVAFRFASCVLFISTAFGQAWSPFAIKIYTDLPEQYRTIYGHVLLLLLFIMLIIGGGIALFAGESIYLIMPAEYMASALPLTILCFGIIIQSSQQVTAAGISLENKTILFAKISWFVAGVNLLGNFLLIPHFGAAGAASSTLISYITLSASYLFFTQRLHPLVVPWLPLFRLSLLGLLMGSISIAYHAQSIEFEIMLVKILVLIFCLIAGWHLLPINSFKEIRSEMSHS